MGIPRFLNRGINIPVGKGGWEPGEGLGGEWGSQNPHSWGIPKFSVPSELGIPKLPFHREFQIPKFSVQEDPKVLDPFRTWGPRALLP